MTKELSEQEVFWAGEFGDAYVSRNVGEDLIAGNTVLFAKILAKTQGIQSVLELGANVGLNLAALRRILPSARLSGVEINPKAAAELERKGFDVHLGSLLDYVPQERFDLVLIKGVLIHINPDRLRDAYRALHAGCGRYLCVAEYYNPTPVSAPYRGFEDRLFKRDFAGELLDTYPDLELIDYGFQYHRDQFPQDDLTWFLLRKRD